MYDVAYLRLISLVFFYTPLYDSASFICLSFAYYDSSVKINETSLPHARAHMYREDTEVYITEEYRTNQFQRQCKSIIIRLENLVQMSVSKQ